MNFSIYGLTCMTMEGVSFVFSFLAGKPHILNEHDAYFHLMHILLEYSETIFLNISPSLKLNRMVGRFFLLSATPTASNYKLDLRANKLNSFSILNLSGLLNKRKLDFFPHELLQGCCSHFLVSVIGSVRTLKNRVHDYMAPTENKTTQAPRKPCA